MDTRYDPDPQTSHDQATEPATAREVLAGVLRNEGADVAAHDMIRREQREAEGIERLSAEYLTLATDAQAERWDALLVRSGLTQTDLDAVRASEAHGPLLAAFREADACGLDVEAAFPQLVARRSLTDAVDVAAVLHGRVHRWIQAASGRRRGADHLIAGLIPRVRGVNDPDMARALTEREHAMERRAAHAGATKRSRPDTIGCSVSGPLRLILATGRAGCARSRRSLPTGSAGTSLGSATIGTVSQVNSTEQMSQFRRALCRGRARSGNQPRTRREANQR